MSRAPRGRAAPPAPDAPDAPDERVAPLDVGALHRRILAQLQEAEARLDAAQAEAERWRQRVWALRGQLDLSAEIAARVAGEPDPDPPA